MPTTREQDAQQHWNSLTPEARAAAEAEQAAELAEPEPSLIDLPVGDVRCGSRVVYRDVAYFVMSHGDGHGDDETLLEAVEDSSLLYIGSSTDVRGEWTGPLDGR